VQCESAVCSLAVCFPVVTRLAIWRMKMKDGCVAGHLKITNIEGIGPPIERRKGGSPVGVVRIRRRKTIGVSKNTRNVRSSIRVRPRKFVTKMVLSINRNSKRSCEIGEIGFQFHWPPNVDSSCQKRSPRMACVTYYG
jgi:hypothetical protein